jgi:hypothetical protein
VRGEAIPALADDHSIGRAFAIELRAALAESEEWPASKKERHAGRRGIEHEAARPRRLSFVWRLWEDRR